ncbi:hypothetical protein [Metabacillus niabensis]|uniref:Uncharacterized protein n=1 Tax=Metabacillus niabensis TaxID=324854 RepID=A0ABT9Z186_9BACI|nr:hypothetical protein [Metabacillus niabensis]MDQ0226006.1 hypothetical protein [Metabacillus niabensis]
MRINENPVTREKLAHYADLMVRKKEIETELDELKKDFNDYFDSSVGKQGKGEIIIGEYKLQRQIRKTEKYSQEATVSRLEELNLHELIQKKPDEGKIKSALNLGLLKKEDLDGCVSTIYSHAISVKQTIS